MGMSRLQASLGGLHVLGELAQRPRVQKITAEKTVPKKAAPVVTPWGLAVDTCGGEVAHRLKAVNFGPGSCAETGENCRLPRNEG